jgi:hypothetical protein
MGVAVEVGGGLGGGAVGMLGSWQPLLSERARIMMSEIIRYFMFIAFIDEFLTLSLVIVASEY